MASRPTVLRPGIEPPLPEEEAPPSTSRALEPPPREPRRPPNLHPTVPIPYSRYGGGRPPEGPGRPFEELQEEEIIDAIRGLGPNELRLIASTIEAIKKITAAPLVVAAADLSPSDLKCTAEFATALKEGNDAVVAFAKRLLDVKVSETSLGQEGHPQRSYELWDNRPSGRSTNPAKWIVANHKDLLGTKGARIKIGNRDPKLIQAYATWIRRHPEDNLHIDTQQRTDLSGMSPKDALTHVRDQKRAATQKSRGTHFVP